MTRKSGPLADGVVRIYVAGPYTKGDVAVNVAKAIEAADVLLGRGYYPFLPHLTHFWHIHLPREYADWLRLDNAFIPACDAVLRLPGESGGADGEVALAKSLGLPVFHTFQELFDILPPGEHPNAHPKVGS